jgi:HlyD family secretion protein
MLKWILVSVAVIGAVAAILLAQDSVAPKAIAALKIEPLRNPYFKGIAGAGIIEPASENVMIGVSEPGLVIKVFVFKGQSVKRGDPLFQTDTRSLEAERLTTRAAVSGAEAELERVMADGRKEEGTVIRAKLAEAQAGVVEANQAAEQSKAAILEREWFLKDTEKQLARQEIAMKGNAVSEEQVDRSRFAVRIAQAQLSAAKGSLEVAQARSGMARARVAQAQGELDKFEAGAWEPDIKKARATIEEAKSRVARLDLEIERRTVRSPLDGEVIRLNLREGEYAHPVSVQPENAAIVLGDLKTKNIRTDIDEFDAPRLKRDLKAVAFLKGAQTEPIALEFVRVEPFIVPKRAVTNSQREIVDTRVLQVIYKITDDASDVYVGQQVDVFIDSAKN